MSGRLPKVRHQHLVNCSAHSVRTNRRHGPHWQAGTLVALLWLLLSPSLTAAVEDRREAVAQESQRYRAEHFPDGHMPPKHDGRHLLSEQPKEVPGGVGYGYYYGNAALLWTNSTIADYY